MDVKGFPQCTDISKVKGSTRDFPLGPLGFNFSQHSPTTRPSVERTAEKAFLLSDRVSLSSAEAREEGIQGGSLGVFELFQNRIALAHAPNPSQP